MPASVVNRLIQARPGEAATAWLMFAYSFLAMTSHNIVKPITKSKFIVDLGPENLPYVLLAASLFIGLLMQLYSRAGSWLPGRSLVPATLAGLSGLLVIFWLLFATGAVWISVAFYVFGLILGILVISQFWTIANEIYDARQARRLFGFIGGGASLGGAMGGGITGFFQEQIGERQLLLISAAVLLLCAALVWRILGRQRVTADLAAAVEERGVGGGEALRLLRESRHLQVIAMVIAFAVLGAVIVEQQLYMAAAEEVDGSVSAFLGKVGFYLSIASFVVQVGLTGAIHRSLGLAFALLVLPVGLGAMALVILATGALWAPAAGRVLDSSLRYSLDKTTREVLFLPLPTELKRRAKPFVDVTVDRLAKAVGALLLLVLIQPWGLGLTWPQLSYASLGVMSLWLGLAMLARREYLRSFRRSLETREMDATAVRVSVADAATVEALVEELAHPDEASVLYAIDMLELLDRRHLITPLLLHHESPKVRARALRALESVRPDLAARWTPAVRRMLKDPDADVRAAAVRALATLADEDASDLMRGFLEDGDARVAATAAVALAESSKPENLPLALATLGALAGDDRDAAVPARREAAAALARISRPEFRALLITLLHDPDISVAREAITSARAAGAADARFVPALVSLLGHRELKAPARAALVGFGEDVIPALAYFLRDQHEHVWVRRHVPATLAALPCRASMDALITALGDPDGFLRFKILEAIDTIARDHPDLAPAAPAIEPLVLTETARYYRYLALRFNLVRHDPAAERSLLVRALDDKLARTLDRVFRLLGLLHSWRDINAARHSIDGRDPRRRAHALEYLDNLLGGVVRRRVMPIVDDLPLAEKVRVGNEFIRSRLRDLDDTLAQLVHEDDPVVAAATVEFILARARWSLADDLAHVASHRADPLVADAARWALAARDRAAGSSEGPRPLVTVADRLRALPLFDFVSVDELFRIAAGGRQVRYEAGRVLHEAGSADADVQFLLEGSVRASTTERATEIEAPAALAFEDMLEGRPIRQTFVAASPAITLSLSRASLLTMMADNIVLARGLFCMLMTSERARIPAAAADLPPWRAPLEAIDKARLLRHAPAFSRATVEQLLDLVAIAVDVPMEAGDVLHGDVGPPAIYFLLSGEVIVEREDGAAAVVRAGDTLGLTETLAGLPMPGRARVSASGYALRIDQDRLFDVLADHVDLLQGLFSGVMGR